MNKRNLVGIDLLKTIAIVSVLIYHINSKILPGGFIGVDLFFVISGYLLASSLVSQHNEKKDIKFFQNIFKRIRQLWPNIFLMIFFVIIFLTIFNKPILQASHKDAIAGMSFSSNWWFIFNKVGYFDSFTVSPFKHLWYIAVLLQAYILVVFLFKGFYKVKILKKYDLFLILMASIAVVSFYYQNKLYTFENVSRVYYGTDTRIYTIIIGVLGYFLYPIDNLRKVKNTKIALISNLLSFVTLFIYVYLMLNVSEVYPWVYKYGFLLFAINSYFMLLSFGSISNMISKIFSYLPFITILGKMSYEIYLWHFPILVLSQSYTEIGSPNLTYTILRLLIIFLLSFLSYNYIQKPISKKGLFKYLEESSVSLLLKNVVFYLVALLFIMGISGLAVPYISTAFVDTSRDIKIANELVTNNKKQSENNNIDSGSNNKEDGNDIQNTENSEAENSEIFDNVDDEVDDIKYSQLILVGDSIGVNIGERILDLYPNSIIDAKVSRQLYNSFDVFYQYKQYDSKNTALIIMLGTNGYFEEEDLDNIIKLFPNSKKIIVNVKAPDSWEKQVNNTFAEYVSKNPEISLVDWYSASKGHPEYFASDQTHMMTDGIDKMMELLLEKLK